MMLTVFLRLNASLPAALFTASILNGRQGHCKQFFSTAADPQRVVSEGSEPGPAQDFTAEAAESAEPFVAFAKFSRFSALSASSAVNDRQVSDGNDRDPAADGESPELA